MPGLLETQGLTKRIAKSARTTAVTDPDHLRQLLEETEGGES